MLNIATVDTAASADVGAENISRAGMVGDVLQDCCCYLNDLGRFLAVTSSQFRIGDSAAANGSLAELVAGLELLLQTIDVVGASLGPDFGASLPGNESLERLMSSLNAVLIQIVQAQERKDWVLIADLLEYELAPHLENWKGIFTSLRVTLS